MYDIIQLNKRNDPAACYPAWCKNPSVNGESVEPGYYETIVSTGDSIIVKLPMKAVFMQANPNVEQDRGMLAVKRGPVIFCAEGIDNEYKLDELYINPSGEVKEKYDEKLLDGVVLLEVPGKYRKQQEQLYYEYQFAESDTTIKMIPYYAWANREESDMSIWFPMV